MLGALFKVSEAMVVSKRSIFTNLVFAMKDFPLLDEVVKGEYFAYADEEVEALSQFITKKEGEQKNEN